MARANVASLLPMVGLCAVLSVAYGLLHGWSALGASADAFFGSFWLFLSVVAVGVVVHEGLHGLAWRWASGLPWSAFTFGFQWKTLTPYAHASQPMPARAYRLGAAAPGVLIGLLPAAVGLLAGWGMAFSFGLFFTFAAGGDVLILWLLRGVAPETLVEDHPTRAGCLVHHDASA